MGLNDQCTAMGDPGVGSGTQHSFVLLGLLGGLGDLASGGDFLLYALDHAHGHSLTHVTHRKTTCAERGANTESRVSLQFG